MGWILKPAKSAVPINRRQVKRMLWRVRLLPWLAAVFPLLGMIYAVVHHTHAMIGVSAGQMIMYPIVIGSTTWPSIAKLKRIVDEDSKAGVDKDGKAGED